MADLDRADVIVASVPTLGRRMRTVEHVKGWNDLIQMNSSVLLLTRRITQLPHRIEESLTISMPWAQNPTC